MAKIDFKKMFGVTPGKTIRLKNYETGWAQTDALAVHGKVELKAKAKELLDRNLAELSQAQELLYANGIYSILIVLQAMDAAGKDGTIKHVMSGVNPQGCQVAAFKQPSTQELDHNFLWRYSKALPGRGQIGIFNRSYYEEVLVLRVHPEILEHQKLPDGKRGDTFWNNRFDDINAFERHLTRNGTVILKFFLNVSKEVQKQRFLERLDNPDKRWKFSASDLIDRAFWDQYMEAFEEAINATSTRWAPWYIIPADHKWVTRTVVADILTSTIRSLDLKPPKISPEMQKILDQSRAQLLSESQT